MAYTVKTTPVGGGQTDISAIVQWPTLNLSLMATKQVSQLTFQIQVTAARTMPAIGDTVDMYDGATHIFGGRITERVLAVDGGLLASYTFTVIDWTFDFDSKMVVKSYTNTDPGTIVLDIISSFTTGFTGSHVSLAGFTIPSISFNYQPASKCLQKIATLVGWDWYIDATKDVHFFLSDTVIAPFALSDTLGNHLYGTLKLDTSMQNLKNSVYVIGGAYPKTYNATTTPDVYDTDGVAMIFPLAYSYDPATISVTLAGGAQTVGTDGTDNPASFNVLYNAGQNGVGAFLRFPSAPTAAQTLKAFGDANIPVLGHAQNSASILSYGEFQDAVVDKLITTVEEAQNRALAEISLYGVPTVTLNFSTLVAGLNVGQTITAQSTKLGITSQSFTIKQISVSAISQTSLRYDIQAESTDRVNYIDIMTLLLEAELMQNQVVNSTILETLLIISESVTIADAISTSTSSPPYKWDTGTTTLVWGFGTWG